MYAMFVHNITCTELLWKYTYAAMFAAEMNEQLKEDEETKQPVPMVKKLSD